MVNKAVTTVNLTEGEITTVEFSSAYPFYWITNMSDSEVYASLGTPEADGDGTYTVAAGSQLRISGGSVHGKLNLLGNGKVQVLACEIAACPFKMPAKGGGNGELTGMIEFAQAMENQPVFGAVTEEE